MQQYRDASRFVSCHYETTINSSLGQVEGMIVAIMYLWRSGMKTRNIPRIRRTRDILDDEDKNYGLWKIGRISLQNETRGPGIEVIKKFKYLVSSLRTDGGVNTELLRG